ncbi:MAG: oxidoreductase [Rhodospirillaceae bacterium]|nr:oxidoreductase [Rhodospirillaceae bacterium]
MTTHAALVTGGGQGIGRAIAARLARDGYRLVLVEHDPEAAEEIAAEFAAGDTRVVVGDVADPACVQEAVTAAKERFGGLDALVNNAGIMIRKPVTALTLDEWNRVLATNLTGAFLTAQAAAPLLVESRGAIVNIASTRATMSEADTEAYSASKGGIVALTHALAVSLGPSVRVNAVSPGWIDVSEWKKRESRHAADLSAEDHAQHPAGRVGRPEDVASLVAYLLGPEAGFITGAEFLVDGGMTRKMIYV